ncbi:putative methyltransferase PMT18 [Acorus calamus]|uniref:Methyltransferase n=1 Tax=Acorus calamus TaxID=4465 RepID=A0AAV9EY68_ACOCL|nr:putative methyltransferase PMT18 [Acorus calamus]
MQPHHPPPHPRNSNPPPPPLLPLLHLLLPRHLLQHRRNPPSPTHQLPKPHLSSSSLSPALDFESHHSASKTISTVDAVDLPKLGFCPSNFTDYCPCQDPKRERRFRTGGMAQRERHCPGPEERVFCRVPRPEGYQSSVRWPESRDRAWFKNVPSTRLSSVKKDQNWVRVEGEYLVFPGGGTSFSTGVKGYVDGIRKAVPIGSGEVRTALDIGCGVASFGGHLLDYNIVTMSVAPRDVHEAQVQFALERGIPAMLGVLSIHRLPYPSRSFDMAHCARCLVPWTANDGLFLLEIDRVLRPGGYWVLSGPPINWRTFYKGWQRKPEDLAAEQASIEDLARRLCWKKVAEKGVIAVWRKPTNHVHCAKKSKLWKTPRFCEPRDPDAAWYEKMESCITPLPNVNAIEDIAGGPIQKWPKRLNAIPPRISSGTVQGITSQDFNKDNQLWNKRISYYEILLSSLPTGKYRNIMDMNAGLGGFAAALSKYPVWVMNSVPWDSTNSSLGAIYDRGLLGTYMDWCEAFSTYPRTYDLIHANGLFSMYVDKCDVLDILLEMDRILRPEGAVIIRDHVDVVVKVKRAADRLNWQSRIVQNEHGPFDPEKLLIVDNSVALSSH